MPNIFFSVLFFITFSAYAKSESATLVQIEAIALSSVKTRLDFHFTQKIEEKPIISRKGHNIIVCFKKGIRKSAALLPFKKIELQAITNYTVREIQGHIQVVLDLSSFVSYSEFIEGDKYILFLEEKKKEATISLHLRHMEVAAALTLIAEISHANIVVNKEVKGEVTLILQNVSWEKALTAVVKAEGLYLEKIKKIWYVRPLGQADTPSLQLETALVPLQYAKAVVFLQWLQKEHTSMLSEKGSISADEYANMLLIRDKQKNIQEIKALLRKWDLPLRQVVIEARIVNMSQKAMEDLGIRFGIPTSSSTTPVEKGEGVTSPRGHHFQVNFGTPGINPIAMGLALAKLGEGIVLDLELSALESESQAEIIATPTLMTTNQQTAVIESGEEVPYQEATSGGATAIAFKKAVLRLQVTPTITQDHHILLTLEINQDALSTRDVNGIPTILTKEIRTNVMIKDRETIVLGGIYKNDKIDSVKRFPFLGNVPLLRSFFRNTHVEMKKEELLIFITPTIIANADINEEKRAA